MSDLTINDDDRAPLALDEWPYIQVADRLEKRIRRGEFGEGGKLPGDAELAAWYGAGIAAIRHARQELERGLVLVVPGRGTFGPARGTRRFPPFAPSPARFLCLLHGIGAQRDALTRTGGVVPGLYRSQPAPA